MLSTLAPPALPETRRRSATRIHGRLRFLPLAALALAGIPAISTAQPAPSFAEADLEFFEKKIRPVLVENCYECHGARKHKAELRLDSREAWLAGSIYGAVVMPGAASASRVLPILRYEDPDAQMPPKGRLSDEVIADLQRWIELGLPWPASAAGAPDGAPAEGEDGAEGAKAPVREAFDLSARKSSHWAWAPIAEVAPPRVAESGAAWPRNEIDRFVLAKLESEGLRPAPEADPRTLLRRLHLDLTGLPPTPDEVRAFLEESGAGSPSFGESAGRTPASDAAYERAVDRLLASPRFAERWARHWLDLMRYAESYGHEQDFVIPHAWRYRDYVIRAFDRDVPYDRFVMEHLAGDVLPEPRMNPDEGFDESPIGAGSWFFPQGTHAPVDVKQDQADRVDNQIDVLGKAFLGMTVACARCHDHKFDAISQKDYYSLYGIVASMRRQEAMLDPGGKIAAGMDRLRALHEQGRAAIPEYAGAASAAWKGSVAPYLLAAREVVAGDWRPTDGLSALRPTIPFEDFERNGFAKWRAEGAAFGDVPRKGRESALSADSFTADGRTTGRLTSAPFLVERDYVRFRLSGRKGGPDTRVELRKGFVAVRSEPVTTSDKRPNDSAPREVVWDVRDLIGSTVRIALVDASTEGGLQADDFLFSQSARRWDARRPLENVASERGLDAATLERWLDALTDPATLDDANPLAPIARAFLTPPVQDGGFSTAAFEMRGRVGSARAAAAERASKPERAFEVFDDFEDSAVSDWFATGEAWAATPTRAGEWRAASASASAGDRLVPPGAVHSGLAADRARGVLRSRTFELPNKTVHLKVAGRSAQIRLVVEGFQIREFHPLLFQDNLLNINHGSEFRWVSMVKDIDKYVGRRCYFELHDGGDGWLAVDEIRFSDDAAPPEVENPVAIALAESPASAVAIDGGSGDGTAGDGATGGSFEALADAAEAILTQGLPAAVASIPLAQRLLSAKLLPEPAPPPALASTLAEIERAAADLPVPIEAVSATDADGFDEFVFVRGGHRTPGEVAPRRFLEAIAGPDPMKIERGSGRLELARAILAPENPLPARVMVNRVWHHLFGRGIVASVDNFGALGERPTHPELLDWMAAEFRRDGWSIKRAIRRVVLSSAYRMSSRPDDPAAEAKDPGNLLVHRMNVRRLEGEAIRDSILAVSGRLDPTMFGPPVPIRMTEFMDGRNPPPQGEIDGQGRRSVYLGVRRNFLPPMMMTFDMPTPDTTVGKRTVSNVPAQALILMNDPFVAGEAARWGAAVAGANEGMGARVWRLFETAFSRPPEEGELLRVLAFVEARRTARGLEREAAKADAALWAEVCHALFMMKEFVLVG